MVARLIRKITTRIYDCPENPFKLQLNPDFAWLRIAIVADTYTSNCLFAEFNVRTLNRDNYKLVIREWRPHFVFVESAFHGIDGSWRYEIARQSKWLLWTNPKAIFKLASFSRNEGIPTVFWNKDDGIYYDNFIHVAKAFDLVLTTDISCIDRYKQDLPKTTLVSLMKMPYQPIFHYFDGFQFQSNNSCFVGSYYRFVLNERRVFQDMLFSASEKAKSVIQVYDRNYNRISKRFAFRFPKIPCLSINPSVSNYETASIYKRYVLSINVNSVTNSESMVSRRLLEILASGGIALTNPSKAISKDYSQYCHVVSDAKEAEDIFKRFSYGPTSADLEMARSGAAYVRAHHTWAHRISVIVNILKLEASS